VYVILCVGGKFAFTFTFYFLDVDILIRPEDAQNYVSGHSFVLLFFFFCNSLFVPVVSFTFVTFSCTEPTEGRVAE